MGVNQTGDNNAIGAVTQGGGSATHSGNIVQGREVHIGGDVAGRDVLRVLDRLILRIDEHAAELAEPARARAAARVLRDEAALPDADSAVMGRMLERLGAAVEHVHPLAADVASLRETLASRR
jgi:hypothetical protein